MTPSVSSEAGGKAALYPFKKGFGNQEKIHYAWEVSHDPHFIYMLDAENGEWRENRKHKVSYWRDGGKIIRGKYMHAGWYNDWGMCGFSDYYYWDIVVSNHFSEWKWQIDKCWELYQGGTRFYGMDNIHITKNNFEWKAI